MSSYDFDKKIRDAKDMEECLAVQDELLGLLGQLAPKLVQFQLLETSTGTKIEEDNDDDNDDEQEERLRCVCHTFVKKGNEQYCQLCFQPFCAGCVKLCQRCERPFCCSIYLDETCCMKCSECKKVVLCHNCIRRCDCCEKSHTCRDCRKYHPKINGMACLRCYNDIEQNYSYFILCISMIKKIAKICLLSHRHCLHCGFLPLTCGVCLREWGSWDQMV